MRIDQTKKMEKILAKKGLEGPAFIETVINRGKNRAFSFDNLKRNKKP